MSCMYLLLVIILCSRSEAVVYHRRYSRYTQSNYSYETRYVAQEIDHFSFDMNETYQQRYLISTAHWKEGQGPVFFYTGNEGDITWFCNNTGFMWDIAPHYNAMLVFAEHRYYGESLPFGQKSYHNLTYLAYLSSEQALADFAVLIANLKQQYNNPPFIAFGGSYGGMLSAWLRIKYPSAVIGSIAASAPIWQFTGLTDCEKPFNIISKLILSYSTDCATNVRNSWSSLTTIATKSPGGLKWLSDTFGLCHQLVKDPSDLVNWLMSVWFDLAEVNYPYSADFLQPLPAWPMRATCNMLSNKLEDDYKLVSAIAEAVQIYYNSTGQSDCLNVTQDIAGSIGEMGWDFQSCTEMVMPMCSDNINDVFMKQPWELSDIISGCVKKYGVTPRPYWIETQYGGKNITSASNIVFSNGEYDPWSAGGVTDQLPSDTLISIIIKEGGHHDDLRAANPNDTDSIKEARTNEREQIDKWLKEFNSKQPS